MKIKKLKLKNFASFDDFECEFNGSVTRLVGVNGSGKTTVGLTSIWAGFKGIAENSKNGQLVGQRFRFIGNKGKSADIEITLVDEDKDAEIKLNRHITKASNQITFDAPETYKINQQWLTDLLNVSFLSAKHFTRLKGKDQALALGINTSEFDEQIANEKEKAKFFRGAIKALGERPQVDQVEKVSVSKLIAERDEIGAFNEQQEYKQIDLDNQNARIKATLEIISSSEESILNAKKELEKLESDLGNIPKPEPEKDTVEIDEKIQNIEEVNNQADQYLEYGRWKADLDKNQKDLDHNLATQKGIGELRLKYIQDFDFGLAGLEVDENGALTLDGKLINEPYFSRGELEMITAALHARQNPDLKVRFIDDFESLDDDNQGKLLDALLKKGFQVITAQVGNEKKEDNTILLRECKVVEEYKDSLI